MLSDRANLLAIFAAVALAAIFAWLGIRDEVAGLVADDAIYLLMADAMHAWVWGSGTAPDFIWDFSRFPPLYPFVLAVFGGGTGSIARAHVVTTVLTLAGFLLLWIYLREFVRKTTATYLTILFALLPGTVLLGVDLWSEHLYLLLSLSALVLHRRYLASRDRAPEDGPGFRAGSHEAERGGAVVPSACVFALIALLCLSRTIGVTMALAWSIHFLRERNRMLAVLGLLTVIPLAAWVVFHPGEHVDPFGSYLALWREEYGSSDVAGLPGALASQVAVQSRSLARGFAELLFGSAQFVPLLIGSVVLLAVVAVAVRRSYDNGFDSTYLLTYLAVILLWPNHDHSVRFLYPVVPLVIVHGIFALFRVREALAGTSLHAAAAKAAGFGPVLALVPFLLIGPATGKIFARVYLGDEMELGGFSRTKLWLGSSDTATALNNIRVVRSMIDGFERLGDSVPAGSCVYSVHHELLMMYGRRLSLTPVPKAFDFYLRSDARPCDYFLVLWLNSHPFLPPGYPVDDDAFGGRVVRQFHVDGDPGRPVFATLYRLE